MRMDFGYHDDSLSTKAAKAEGEEAGLAGAVVVAAVIAVLVAIMFLAV